MPSVKELTRSFAGGEITPEMYGRLDNVKFQTGLALCRNAVILPHGPVAKRAGFGYVNTARGYTTAVRLIPFAFSATQTMVLEFGAGYIRFHTQGATLLEGFKTVTAVTAANPGVLTIAAHGYANGDWVYVDQLVGPGALNYRYFKVANVTTNTFTLQTPTGIDVSTVGLGAYASGGRGGRLYQITTPYAAADLFALGFTQSSDVITLTHNAYPVYELRRLGAANWTLTSPLLGSSVLAPTISGGTATAGTGTPNNKSMFYRVTTVTPDGVEESLPSAAYTLSNDLTLLGSKNVISWPATVAGAPTYRVYKAMNNIGRLYGFVGETSDLTFTDDNITPDYSRNPPATTIRLDTVGNYPATAAYYEQRRMFAGSVTNPQTVYGTKSGTESNLSASLPSNAADALSFTIKAPQQNAIRHLIPLNDLIALTASGAWKIGSSTNAALSPATLSVRAQAYYGANQVHPQLTGTSCLYVETSGRRVRDLNYSWQAQVYTSEDRSIMAPHLFNSFALVDSAYTRSPDHIAWYVRNDGVLLGMSYVPEHQVFGWHQHTTDGTFESVCAVNENNEDVLYAVVLRTLNGVAVRTIERAATRLFATQADAFFVDCGLSYSFGTATTVLTALDHLEGKTVAVLADGAVVSGLVVTGGAITLPIAAFKVQVGLPFTTDIQTLPMALEQSQAGGQGTMKSIDYSYLRVNRTGIIRVGPTSTRLTTFPPRSNENYDTAPRLRSEILDLLIQPEWGPDAQLWVQSADPTPMTVSAITMKVSVGG